MTEKVATAVKLRLDKKRDLSSENKYKYEMQMKINFHAQLKIVNKFPSFPVSQFPSFSRNGVSDRPKDIP